MKDMDLLPQWYTSGKRKKRSLRSQYMVLAGIVTAMVVWNFVTAGSLSAARAQLDGNGRNCAQAQAVLEQSQQLTDCIEKLSKKAALLEDIDSRINVANVLSELSFLVDGKIVLSEVGFEAKRFETGKGENSSPASRGIRVAWSASRKSGVEPFGDVRFAVSLVGIADQTSDVGEFVRRLEESDYFRDVSLAFSRSKSIKTSAAGSGRRQVSEFEISCYLANYRIEQGRSSLK
jgi:hypothetical protein